MNIKASIIGFLALSGIVLTGPQAFASDQSGLGPELRAKRLDCVYSPTRREWELDRGGKACRKKALRFIRVTRSFAGYRPALSGCSTRRPKKVWRCTATQYRTTNIESGNIVAGRFVKVGRQWVVRGLRFPDPDFLFQSRAINYDRTCGLLPGDGAYGYIRVKNISCGAGKRVAFRSRKKFCSSRNGCLIDPSVDITAIIRGKVKRNGWKCKVAVGWEYDRIKCRKGKKLLIWRAAA